MALKVPGRGWSRSRCGHCGLSAPPTRREGEVIPHPAPSLASRASPHLSMPPAPRTRGEARHDHSLISKRRKSSPNLPSGALKTQHWALPIASHGLLCCSWDSSRYSCIPLCPHGPHPSLHPNTLISLHSAGGPFPLYIMTHGLLSIDHADPS